MELQKNWYERYLNDPSQGLFMVIDKKTNTPFATMGYTDYDSQEKVLISGRLLVGEIEYRGSKEWQEATQVVFDYYNQVLGVNVIYAHIVKENIASIRWHKKWGFSKNTLYIKFPGELIVNGMEQIELYKELIKYNRKVYGCRCYIKKYLFSLHLMTIMLNLQLLRFGHF